MKITVKPWVVNYCLLEKRKKVLKDIETVCETSWQGLGIIMMCKEFLDNDRSPREHLSRAFCLSTLSFAFMSCLSLGGEISPLKAETIFNSKKEVYSVFMDLFLCVPSSPHTLLLPSPCPSLTLPAGVCQSWVPDAEWGSQCRSPSWVCYWLALPKSNRIANRYCRASTTCVRPKFSSSVCARVGTGGFSMCSPILITAVACKGRRMATFIANSCFLISNCVCGSVQSWRGFWQLAGAAVFTLSCDN